MGRLSEVEGDMVLNVSSQLQAILLSLSLIRQSEPLLEDEIVMNNVSCSQPGCACVGVTRTGGPKSLGPKSLSPPRSLGPRSFGPRSLPSRPLPKSGFGVPVPAPDS